MQSIIFLTLLMSVFVSSFRTNSYHKWLLYKAKYGKSYMNNTEEIRRYNVYKKNLEKIDAHNEKFTKNEVTYQMGVNQFTVMTKDEFTQIYLGKYNLDIKNYKLFNKSMTHLQAPDSLNYQNYCLPPLDQGDCGGCWAFAACAQVEAQYTRRNGNKFYFSPQYVLDCSGAGTCQGGVPYKALEYMDTNGVVTDSDYPYEGIQRQCKSSPKRYKLGMKTSFYKLNANEDSLKELLFKNGPIVILIEVVDGFPHYSTGIYSNANCDNSCQRLNHAVVVVGYGRSENSDYWLIKNSWGSGWGESGYFKFKRNQNNFCNVACYAAFSYFNN